MLLGLLRAFPGYTLGSLLAEDAALLRLLKVEALGKPPEPPGGDFDGG